MNQPIKTAQALHVLAKRAVKKLASHGCTVSTAESCTGGLIAKAITDVPGSSAVLCGGFVTYTNEIKIGVLGVDPDVIARHTEVSFACAEAMARCAREKTGSAFTLSTTGYAGPSGGTDADPVGTVYIGIATPNGVRSERICVADATRTQVRITAAYCALQMLMDEMNP